MLSGCGLFSGSSDVEEALEYLPADASTVTFVDRAAVMERLDLEDVDGDASSDDMENYLKTLAEDGAALTQLDSYANVMAGDAAFSAFDVLWEATSSADDQRVVVWKLDDEVDFDKVADDLEDAGYERSGSKDHPRFSAAMADAGETGLIGDRYPASLLELALVPDEHLVVSGDVDAALDVVTDDADSLSDKGSFDDLLDRAPSQDDLEFAAMKVEVRCDGGGRMSPAQIEALKAQAGTLGTPKSIGLYVEPDERVTVARLFGGEDDAKAEAKGLEDYLEESGKQTGLDVDFDVDQDGDAVLAEADFDDRRNVIAAWQRGEGPFMCLPAS